MAALFQVTIRWIKTEVAPDKVQPAFDSVGNWARLSAYSWFVWSNLSAPQIYEILRHHFHAQDSIAVFEVKPETRAGWAPQWFWDWVNSGGTTQGPK
jgi:hypothetical protein